jgi:hypothetical protein
MSYYATIVFSNNFLHFVSRKVQFVYFKYIYIRNDKIIDVEHNNNNKKNELYIFISMKKK